MNSVGSIDHYLIALFGIQNDVYDSKRLPKLPDESFYHEPFKSNFGDFPAEIFDSRNTIIDGVLKKIEKLGLSIYTCIGAREREDWKKEREQITSKMQNFDVFAWDTVPFWGTPRVNQIIFLNAEH